MAESFDGAIQQVKTAIDDMVARKIDPVKVPAEGGSINLRKTLTQLVAERDRTTAEIETALAGSEAAGQDPQLADA